jgi:hypothetical protein
MPSDPAASGEFLLYTTPDGETRVECRFKDETIWLSQKLIAELFGAERSVVTKHLANIFKEGELEENSVCAKFAHTATDGKTYRSKFYNLDTIIAVGYRVNSHQATHFRIWATQILREFIIKGFAMDDERLKQGGAVFGKDYFDELLERIRDIRSSERRFYQKITDIYALSMDYDREAPVTRNFFATVQNKLHWAITGKTAAEQIYASVDAAKLNMGLATWKNAPTGKILKSDVSIAKNPHFRTQPHRLCLPRPRRKPRRTRHPHEDGRLGGLPAQFPRTLQLPHPSRPRENHSRRSPTESRGRTLAFSKTTRPRLPLRL